MNLPNYFLADLPPEASLNAGMITDACQTLKHNREHYLRDRSTDSLVRVLSELGASWLDPDYSFRRMALAANPQQTGFEPATLARGLDDFFRQLTAENLDGLLVQDLGHARRLDTLCSSSVEQRTERKALARGPELLVHIAAGNLPNPAFMSLILGLLVRSAQVLKCASGAALLPRLFAHSLYELEPKLGACLELAEWAGGRHDLEGPLFAEADCVTVTGSDETLASIRHHIPPAVRFLGYGHRVSFGYITREVLSGYNVPKLVTSAAADVAAWNQLGCLSPHVFYVERGGKVSDEGFAELLAQELERLEASEPRGVVSERAAASIANRRAFYDVRAAHSPDTRHWRSPESTAWTVVYEADPRFQMSCLYRFIYVKPVSGVTEALQAADTVRRQVSTVGLGATEERAVELATTLGRWGAARVCPIGQMQQPPLTWRHDGHPPLADLVTWTDWEQPR